MAKRKAAVNDIIYELDNEDIVISSEDEATEAKINRLDITNTEDTSLDNSKSEGNNSVIILLDTPDKKKDELPSSTDTHNGGKISPDNSFINLSDDNTAGLKETENEVDINKKTNTEGNKTTILNEDIIIDSPTSTSDLGVVGCENRTPLVTIRFRDKKLASNYKARVKAFMLRLIKLHEKDNSVDIDNETDIELDIWPEDLIDEEDFEIASEKAEQDDLFFVDTDPCSNKSEEIPTYKEVSSLISNQEEKELSPPRVFRRGPVCFNCDGAHQLRECKLPRDHVRIAEKRKVIATRVGRYHVEDEQKYGHLIPGRISGQLRHALGLKRHELPLHIYRMRILGYPPGWLEEARISHSGITMFDSTGAPILDPEEEEGELCEPGSKDKFDIKKILDFPGFNVPASSRYKEEGHVVSAPPMSVQDSKIAMLQMLAPNAMKAYKRKKLTLFPSAANASTSQEVAEMELDSGDELVEFPSVPPLPDEAPPPPPPPPPPHSPPPPPPPPHTPLQPATPEDKVETVDDISTDDDIEVIEVIRVGDIPVPEKIDLGDIPIPEKVDFGDIPVPEKVDLGEIPEPMPSITIDGDDEVKDKPSGGRSSPSLDDLEKRKQQLLNALTGEKVATPADTVTADKIESDNLQPDETPLVDKAVETQTAEINNKATDQKLDISMEEKETETAMEIEKQTTMETDKEMTMEIEKETTMESEKVDNKTVECKEVPVEMPSSAIEESKTTDSVKTLSTPESKTGHVKTTLYGTPVINNASPYDKLPSGNKFAKDICDVINFENLPNSIGKYKKICNILKRVKNEVDRIQDS